MKAPSKLNSFLHANGFGYFAPTYVRVHKAGRHGESIQIDRHRAGLTITLGASYFCSGQVFPYISPNEIRIIWTDGTIASTGGSAAFWAPSDVASMLEATATVGLSTLKKLSEPRLMIRIYEYLIEDTGQAPADLMKDFPSLGEPWILRKCTPLRLMNLAAYLNLARRFDAAREVAERYKPRKPDFFQVKVLEDAKAKRIAVSRESLDFLRSVGATVPDSVYEINKVGGGTGTSTNLER